MTNTTFNIESPAITESATLARYGNACLTQVAKFEKQADTFYLNIITGLACIRLALKQKNLKTKEVKQGLFKAVEDNFNKVKAPLPCDRQLYFYVASAEFILKNITIQEHATDAEAITEIVNKVQSYKSFSKIKQAMLNSKKKPEPRAPKSDIEKFRALIDSAFALFGNMSDDEKSQAMAYLNDKLNTRQAEAM